MTRFLAGADVGGTFTDLALYDGETGTLTLNKLLTTPDDPARAILEGLRAMQAPAGQVVHGTTLVTNALIERRGAPVGLITTDGYRDVLEIGNELRYDTFDLELERPAPLVARPLRKAVKERIGAKGDIVVPLDEAGVRAAAKELVAAGARSLAIAFFNSYRNPAHELAAKALVQAACPGIAVCASAEIAPEIREYERFSTAVANAYVAPIAMRYLVELERLLGVPLFVMLSDGGITTARSASEQPIALVESGPAAGAMGAAFLCRQAEWRDVIAFDMGGTTAKISLIHDGRPHRSHELEAARLQRFKKGSGLPLRLPVIELIEIGAGGGSIAAPDGLGLMRVGPRSAGAVPGPACYSQGGEEPTVTDADLMRGYLSPERFLGGRMRLDRRAGARRACAARREARARPRPDGGRHRQGRRQQHGNGCARAHRGSRHRPVPIPPGRLRGRGSGACLFDRAAPESRRSDLPAGLGRRLRHRHAGRAAQRRICKEPHRRARPISIGRSSRRSSRRSMPRPARCCARAASSTRTSPASSRPTCAMRARASR